MPADFLEGDFFETAFFGAFLAGTFFETAFLGGFLAGIFFEAFFAAGREVGFAAFTARFAGAFPFAGFAFAAIRFPAADFLEGDAAFRAGAFFPPFFAAEVGFVPLGVGFLDAALFFGTALPLTDFFLEAAVAERPAFFPFAAGIKELRSVMKTR